MLALTIHQPWAHFIAEGRKRVENRDWPPPPSLLGKWIAIHAGRHYDLPGAIGIRDGFAIDVPMPDELVHGAIIAVAVLDRVAKTDHEAGYDEWYVPGLYGWFFRDVVKIDPVPCAGHRNLWPVSNHDLKLVRAAYRKTLPPKPSDPLVAALAGRAWACTRPGAGCGWTGTRGDLTSSNPQGTTVCPACGASGGLQLLDETSPENNAPKN